jgi:hypothetical protein
MKGWFTWLGFCFLYHPKYSHINYLISPHLSPYMGKTPPHMILYIDVEEMNDSSDMENHP